MVNWWGVCDKGMEHRNDWMGLNTVAIEKTTIRMEKGRFNISKGIFIQGIEWMDRRMA